MKYCQGPKCHEYKTKDRIRGPKGDKHYATRRRSNMYYMGGNVCSMQCQNDWFQKFGEQAINHFGKITEPKKVSCDQAWYKSCSYNYNNGSDSNYDHYIVNDLLGEKRPITEAQYNDENYTINSS